MSIYRLCDEAFCGILSWINNLQAYLQKTAERNPNVCGKGISFWCKESLFKI